MSLILFRRAGRQGSSSQPCRRQPLSLSCWPLGRLWPFCTRSRLVWAYSNVYMTQSGSDLDDVSSRHHLIGRVLAGSESQRRQSSEIYLERLKSIKSGTERTRRLDALDDQPFLLKDFPLPQEAF